MALVERAVNLCGVRTPLTMSGQGPALLVLEGANHLEGWLPIYDSLARDFTVILPTHPGYTGAGPADWLDSVSDLANYYLDFLKAEGLSGVHLVGLSLGGWIAADLAVRNTSRLASLTLVGAPGLHVSSAEPLDIFLRSDAEFMDDLFHSAEAGAAAKAAALAPEREDRLLHNKVTTAKLAWEPRLHDPDLRKWLHRVDVPTSIVWGEQDRVIPPAHAAEWARLIPGARVSTIPNCGHVPQVEAPEALERIIRGFIGSGA